MKQIKVSDRVHEELTKLAEKLNTSINNVVEMLLSYYLTGRESDKPIKHKIDVEIPSKYPTKCSKCGREIQIGQVFRYIRIMYEDGSSDTIKLCEDCMLSSTLLAKAYKKIRQLKAIEREYKKEIDALLDKLEELEAQVSIAEVKRELTSLYKELYNALLSTDQSTLKKLDEILLKIEAVESKIAEIPLYKTLKNGIYKSRKAREIVKKA